MTADGAPGLLASFTFGATLLNELPDLTDKVDEVKEDSRMVCALYRDYSFVASAYLLEPCHERWINGEGYGLGRQRLPACVARPLARVAEMYVFCNLVWSIAVIAAVLLLGSIFLHHLIDVLFWNSSNFVHRFNFTPW